jgi:mono/diheme cytochrome c family protein
MKTCSLSQDSILVRTILIFAVMICGWARAQNPAASAPSEIAKPAPQNRPIAIEQAETKRQDPRHGSPQYQRAIGVFIDKCSQCHGEKGSGDGVWHNDFHPHPANLSLINDSPSMLRSIVANGIAGTMMPNFPDLDNQSLDDILLYLSLQPRDLSGQWDHPWELEAKMGKAILDSDPQAGKQFFIGLCVGCHGNEGEGNGTMAKVDTIWPKPANFHGRSSDIGRIYYIISYGRLGTFMAPNNDKLPELTRWRLAQYVLSLYDKNSTAQLEVPRSKPPVRTNPYLREDQPVVQNGKKRYDLWCSPCHGSEGRGSYLAPRLIDREWKYGDGTDTAVFTVVQEGLPGRLMVSFQKLSEEERWNIITFLRNKGGLPDPLAGLAQPPRQKPSNEPSRGGNTQ